MNQPISENPQDGIQRRSIGEPAGSGSWHERLMVALAGASESNLSQLKTLIRIGLGLMFLFEVASWLEVVRFEPAFVHPERLFFVFDVALVGVAFYLTYFNWFGANWRTAAMAFCCIVIAGRTFSTLVVNEDEPLVLALLALVLVTAVLVPWSVRWQGAFTLAGLVAIAAVDRVVVPMDLPRWLVLPTVGAFALSFTALKDQYRAQAGLIATLLDKEHGLAKSQAMLRTVFDAVPDIVTLTRFSDGKLFEVNDELLRRSGLTREQALSTSVTRANVWVHPEERDEYIKRLRESGHVRNLEADFRLNGVIAPYLMSSVAVEIEGEVFALNVARDAAQIKENERALREARERLSAQIEELTATQARLRAEIVEREAAERLARERETMMREVFEASPDVIMVLSRRDSRLIQTNSAFFRETGYSPQEVLGRQIYPIFWSDPAQRARLLEALDREGVARNIEADLRMKDGTVNSYLLSAVAVDLNDEPCRISFWRNVTENKRAARRVASSEAKLRKIFDAIPDIVITRCGDLVGDVNEEFVRRAGLSRAQVLGRPIEEAVLFLRPEARAEFLRRIRADGIVRNFQADFKLQGAAVPYLVSGAMFETEDGPMIFSISRDISSRIEMERDLVATREAALDASRAKSDFLSSMSHEIRTPMNAILGMADLLSDGPLSEEQRRYVDTMRSNGNALLRLINDILDVAKIESGRLSLESVSFSLEEVVDRVTQTMAIRAHAKGLELTVRILPGVPFNLIGDPLRLNQILMNLIANAIKFTGKGEVSLTVESLAPGEALRLGFTPAAVQARARTTSVGWLRFSVVDTGIGIAADEIGTIFSSFTQADASVSRRFGGSGLGLTIVRRLSEMMGGWVEVQSEVGHGSTFQVTLPLGVDPGSAAAAERASAVDQDLRGEVRLDGVRILIVDDNATNRLILREMLAGNRAEVAEAASGEAALVELEHARAAGRPYRLMLLDYRMPGMDGMEIARKAIGDGFPRKSANGQDTTILMLTSDDLNFRLARMREAGLHTHLIKPVKRAELFEKIRYLLNGGHIQARPASTELAVAPEAAVPLRILLAEDSPDNRFLIQAYLKKHPYHIDVAENGRVAIEKFKSAHPDLVLMDVQMPETDGLTATRAIRQWESERGLPPTPIIALTASVLEDDVKRSLAAGCDAHVSKPVKRPVLLAAIATAAAMRLAVRVGLEAPTDAGNPSLSGETAAADPPLA
jgi:two-component system, sensor histidine kinase and response regulator